MNIQKTVFRKVMPFALAAASLCSLVDCKNATDTSLNDQPQEFRGVLNNISDQDVGKVIFVDNGYPGRDIAVLIPTAVKHEAENGNNFVTIDYNFRTGLVSRDYNFRTGLVSRAVGDYRRSPSYGTSEYRHPDMHLQNQVVLKAAEVNPITATPDPETGITKTQLTSILNQVTESDVGRPIAVSNGLPNEVACILPTQVKHTNIDGYPYVVVEYNFATALNDHLYRAANGTASPDYGNGEYRYPEQPQTHLKIAPVNTPSNK